MAGDYAVDVDDNEDDNDALEDNDDDDIDGEMDETESGPTLHDVGGGEAQLAAALLLTSIHCCTKV